MPRVSDQYREARRLEIVQAAMRAFNRKGFQGTSIAQIIEESGLSAGAIYGNFKNKDDLVMHVATHVMGARMLDVERLRGSDPMPPPANLIRVLVGGMMNDLGSPGILVQLWGEAVSDPQLRELAARVLLQLRGVYSDYISAWQQHEHGLPPAEAERVAHEQVGVFVGTAQGYLLQSALVEGFDGEAFLTNAEKYLPR